MDNEKIKKVILCILAFFVGRAVVFGVNPFVVPFVLGAAMQGYGAFLLLFCADVGMVFGYGASNLYGKPLGEVLKFGTMNQQNFTGQIIRYSTIIILSYIIICMRKEYRRKSGKASGYFGGYGVAAIIILGINIIFAVTASATGKDFYFLDIDNVYVYLVMLSESIISFALIRIFEKSIRVLLKKEADSRYYNEEILSILAMLSVILWGIPFDLSEKVPLLYCICIYLVIYVCHRLGVSYGMGCAGICGIILGLRYDQGQYVGGLFILALFILTMRAFFEKRKYGTLIGYMAGYFLAGYGYFSYLLTKEGLVAGTVVGLAFALTPRSLLSVLEGNSFNEHSKETAQEMTRITAEKIRELSGAFKRIEYTLAGCGSMGTNVSLGEIGDIIGKFSDNLDSVEPVFRNSEGRLRELFASKGVVMTHLTVVRNEKGRRIYYLTAHTKGRQIMLSKDGAKLLEQVFEEAIRPAENTSAIICENDRVITFEEQVGIKCSYDVRRVKKYGSSVSGDNYSVKENNQGSLVMMISDGMGTGSLASCESSLMVDTMEEMVEAGFDPMYAISFANKCITSRNEGRTFTTFDMGVLDMYTGTLKLYKQGAAPTYVIRQGGNKKVETYRGSSLPVGIIPEASCDEMEVEIYNGDIVVMISDGVFSNLSSQEDESYLEEAFSAIEGEDAREIMEEVMAEVLQHNNGKFQDDATIVVLKVDFEEDLYVEDILGDPDFVDFD